MKGQLEAACVNLITCWWPWVGDSLRWLKIKVFVSNMIYNGAGACHFYTSEQQGLDYVRLDFTKSVENEPLHSSRLKMSLWIYPCSVGKFCKSSYSLFKIKVFSCLTKERRFRMIPCLPPHTYRHTSVDLIHVNCPFRHISTSVGLTCTWSEISF